MESEAIIKHFEKMMEIRRKLNIKEGFKVDEGRLYNLAEKDLQGTLKGLVWSMRQELNPFENYGLEPEEVQDWLEEFNKTTDELYEQIPQEFSKESIKEFYEKTRKIWDEFGDSLDDLYDRIIEEKEEEE